MVQRNRCSYQFAKMRKEQACCCFLDSGSFLLSSTLVIPFKREGYSPVQICQCWCQNQWNRERAHTILRLSSFVTALGHSTSTAQHLQCRCGGCQCCTAPLTLHPRSRTHTIPVCLGRLSPNSPGKSATS